MSWGLHHKELIKISLQLRLHINMYLSAADQMFTIISQTRLKRYGNKIQVLVICEILKHIFECLYVIFFLPEKDLKL